MKQSTVGSLVGYNVQNIVDTEHKLIVAHEVTNKPTDRGQLLPMAKLAKETLGPEEALTVLADRGYYKGTDIYDCVKDKILPLVPKSMTSTTGAAGLFPREAFKYEPENLIQSAALVDLKQSARTDFTEEYVVGSTKKC